MSGDSEHDREVDRDATRDADRAMLEAAARIALRAHGEAEPNPTVGCIVHDREGRRAGAGRTRAPGGPHAEVVALAAAGDRARGGTMWVTLEPCNHHGRTPPCVDAILDAGVARVVVGRRDRHALAAGGLDRLRAAGVVVDVHEDVAAVQRLHAPFDRAILDGLPWVTAKWAETRRGDLVAPPGHDRRISGAASHRLVHRERGRCDAILTGVGTIIADDPRLDPRGPRPRRVPRRVVVDPAFDVPVDARLFHEGRGDVTIAAHATALARRAADQETLRSRGVTFLPLEGASVASGWPDGLPAGLLETVLRRLHRDHAVSHVLTEAGPGLLDALFGANLVDGALVFTAAFDFPGDPDGASARTAPRRHVEAGPFESVWRGRRGDDLVTWWHRRPRRVSTNHQTSQRS